MDAFIGRLLGSMLNPVVIAIVLAAVIIMRNRPLWAQLASALVAVLVAGLLLYSFDNFLTAAEKARGLTFGLLSALVWFGIFAGVRRLRGR
ncbi:MAG: hypothetical protein EOR00_09475 [Mesorhizobium sp.]|uniref:hypothetical protein n=1 Tax=Mesorhizobium sp. TaxID=1871066 RepID=UPI000FE8F660|nr:hypothetical protein [Mesorhizobium sp.]RWP18858.1 MAG: hypothetical protein EOR00_09475 [Mesorhizobium sp.]